MTSRPAPDRSGQAIAVEVERVFREVHGHAVATLVGDFGDITVAEDAVQEAFVVATTRWVEHGLPANPAGWIITTARRRAIDELRRSARGRELVRTSVADSTRAGQHAPEVDEDVDAVNDDRLRLIFTCCHPALRAEHQVALTLRLLGGLTVEEIARAFLVNESTMAKRLTRAKFKIKAANIGYRVPERSELTLRLYTVLSVLYLIYNAGTEELAAQAPLRREAIRLARAVVTLLPDEPEAGGLVALMLLNESRMPARRIDDETVLLRDQDRRVWNRTMIDEGHDIVHECIRIGAPGPFQLQAAIQAVHCDAETYDATDWPQIVALYNHLYALAPSPVVALNRAIAIAETDGPDIALRSIDNLRADLDRYSPLHAARAALLRRRGELSAAQEAYERAASLATSNADRSYLLDQAAGVAERRRSATDSADR